MQMTDRDPSMPSASWLLSCEEPAIRINQPNFGDGAPTACGLRRIVHLEAASPPEVPDFLRKSQYEPSIPTGHLIIVSIILFTITTMIFVLMGCLRWLRSRDCYAEPWTIPQVGEDTEK